MRSIFTFLFSSWICLTIDLTIARYCLMTASTNDGPLSILVTLLVTARQLGHLMRKIQILVSELHGDNRPATRLAHR